MWYRPAMQQNMWLNPQQEAEKQTSLKDWGEMMTTVIFNLSVPSTRCSK